MLETIDNLIEFARMQGLEPKEIKLNEFTNKIFVQSCKALSLVSSKNENSEVTSVTSYTGLKVTIINDLTQKIHIEIL